jgi:hypothetical protein
MKRMVAYNGSPALGRRTEKKKREIIMELRLNVIVFSLVWIMSLGGVGANEAEFTLFDTNDTGGPGDNVPLIKPWKVIPLDADFGGSWYSAGDLDGDGVAEIVSAENFNEGDVHYTSAVAAHRLDGSVMWTWGDAEAGRKKLHHDVGCQIHDWDGDGRNEVVVAAKDAVVELEGRTGAERLRFSIEKEATDSITFCDFTGDGHGETILVKDRYKNIWAYTREGELRWHVKEPGGFRTAHQPRPMDIDGDGVDEVFAGYAMLNADGSVRWTVASKAVKQERGHLDCARLMQRGATAAETRIALTFCGANNIAVVDGNGAIQWELSGYHFESIQVGRIVPDAPGPQLLVDVDHQPKGKSPIWVVGGATGKPLGQVITNYSRQHRLVDWDGDGLDEFVVAQDRGLYDHTGQRIATFDTDKQAGNILHTGDMTGDNRPDVLLLAGSGVYIFENKGGKKQEARKAPGTGLNVTLY